MKTFMKMTERDTLIEELLENMGAMKRSMYGRMQLPKACPVSRPQLDLLYAIRQLQPISFKELAQRLSLTPGFISQLTEGVEAQGFVSREPQLVDRRVHHLRVTKKGQRMLATIERSRREHMKDVMGGLTDHELATWLKVQNKILDRLQAIVEPEPKTKKG